MKDNVNKDSVTWRISTKKRCSHARQCHENAHQQGTRHAAPRTESQIRQGVLNGTIPSAISNTGATSSAGLIGDPYIPTSIKPTTLFHMPNSSNSLASDVCKLEHPFRDPARTVDMAPSLVDSSLLSTSKLAREGYITVYDRKEVNLYDGHTTNIIVSEEALLKGWRCPRSTLWNIPLTF